MELSPLTILSAAAFVACNPNVRASLHMAVYFGWKHMPTRGLIVSMAIAGLFLLAPAQAQAQRRRPSGNSRVDPHWGNVSAGETVAFKGSIRVLGKSKIELDMEGDQSVTIVRNKKTKFFLGKTEVPPEKIPLETPLTIDVQRDATGELTAVNVVGPEPAPPKKSS